MENLGIDDIENNSDSDHVYAEKEATCLLEESDAQCGYVFFSRITRLLKFHCTYCRETYDNVEYFCQHLSGHINESNEEFYIETESLQFKNELEERNEIDEVPDSESSSANFLKDDELKTNSYLSSQKNDNRDAFGYEHQLEEEPISNENVDESDEILYNLNTEEMFIEEIEDADEIPAEVGQIQEESQDCLFLPENSCSSELLNCDEKSPIVEETNMNLVDNSNNGSSFEECFIKETNIDKIRSEGVCVLKEKNHPSCSKPMQRRRSNIQDLLRLKRRRKKVTTVKVIAVKNRIAELYERIHSEQQKSQQLFANDFNKEHHEQETQDAIESLISDETDNKTDMSNNNQTFTDETTRQSTSEISRKIIGETLITLIPEGTKIPDKLPSPISTPLDNELNKKKPLPLANTRYIHYKTDDKKENVAVCPACGKTFRSHFSLTIHKRIHYLESDSSVKLAHKCSDCDQLFNKLSQLKHHVETVHYPEGFVCKICNRQLSSLSLLERHMVKVHLDRPFNCKKCNKNFSDPHTYEEHLASHDSGEVFKCTTCGRKYSTEYFLLEHMRNHKEQVPQTCVVCGKVTLRITQHMKIHTPRPKRLLSCSECGKVFNFSSGLSHHFKIMHKLPRPPPKPKKETQSCNTFKRKRRSRTNERSLNKKNQLLNSNTADITDEKLSDQIIEEQIEIPHEVYGTSESTVITNIDKKENRIVEQSMQQSQGSSHTYSITNSQGQRQQVVIQNFHQDAAINHKEEEAKRVIVELIQNSSYTSFFPDNFSSVMDATPPIAREETISAVNSIVHEC